MTHRRTNRFFQQGQTAAQIQSQELGQRQNLVQSQRISHQQLITSDPRHLDEETLRQLEQNPALLAESPAFTCTQDRDLPDGYHESWAKPADEYDGSEGRRQSRADDDVSFLDKARRAQTFARATFQVKLVNGKVTAVVTATTAGRLRATAGLSYLSKSAGIFVERARSRLMTLSAVAVTILERRQEAFFRAGNLETASLLLVPIEDPANALHDLPVKWDKSYKSRLGVLGVQCSLGTYPLHMFWPQPKTVRSVWEQKARAFGLTSSHETREWLGRIARDGLTDFPPLPDKLKKFLLNCAQPSKKKTTTEHLQRDGLENDSGKTRGKNA